MSDVLPEFETKNELGRTVQLSGTVGTTPILLPASPTVGIDEVMIRCPQQSPSTRRLEASFDGGTNWVTLQVGEFLIFSPRSDASGNRIRQITLRANTSGVSYELLINLSNV